MPDDIAGGGLARAFVLESRARARSEVFGKKAQAEDRPALEALFKAAAKSSQMPARRCLMRLRGKIDPSLEKVAQDFRRETQSTADALQDLLAQDRGQADHIGALILEQSLAVVRRRLELMDKLSGGKQASAYLVCEICGYIAEDAAPEACPVCGAVPQKFAPA